MCGGKQYCNDEVKEGREQPAFRLSGADGVEDLLAQLLLGQHVWRARAQVERRLCGCPNECRVQKEATFGWSSGMYDRGREGSRIVSGRSAIAQMVGKKRHKLADSLLLTMIAPACPSPPSRYICRAYAVWLPVGANCGADSRKMFHCGISSNLHEYGSREWIVQHGAPRCSSGSERTRGLCIDALVVGVGLDRRAAAHVDDLWGVVSVSKQPNSHWTDPREVWDARLT